MHLEMTGQPYRTGGHERTSVQGRGGVGGVGPPASNGVLSFGPILWGEDPHFQGTQDWNPQLKVWESLSLWQTLLDNLQFTSHQPLPPPHPYLAGSAG